MELSNGLRKEMSEVEIEYRDRPTRNSNSKGGKNVRVKSAERKKPAENPRGRPPAPKQNRQKQQQQQQKGVFSVCFCLLVPRASVHVFVSQAVLSSNPVWFKRVWVLYAWAWAGSFTTWFVKVLLVWALSSTTWFVGVLHVCALACTMWLAGCEMLGQDHPLDYFCGCCSYMLGQDCAQHDL